MEDIRSGLFPQNLSGYTVSSTLEEDETGSKKLS